jgi:ribosomal protein S12 methylthiotransferase
MNSVIRETEGLVDRGVVEVTLVAQDTTAYGVDRGKKQGLYRLLKGLTKITGLQWIRFLYAYPHPENFPASFVDMVAAQERICPYFDIPIQHIDNTILRRMGRRVAEKEIRTLVYRIKKDYPHIHLRTTLMVGFPGEKEEEFKKLADFVQEVEFSHVGVFTYSPEEGTKACRMHDRIPSEIAAERAAQLMEIQQEIAWKRNKKMIGSMVPVLIDGISVESEKVVLGRTAYQAPEVDGIVHIDKGMARAGEIVTVKITHADPYDLVGKIVRKP